MRYAEFDDGPADTRPAPRPSARLEVVLFFASAVGATVGWTSLLSGVVHFSARFGPDSFIWLNAAVFLPLLPISVTQAALDDYFDREIGSSATFPFRGSVCFLAMSTALVAIAYGPRSSLPLLLVVAATLGTAAAALQGTLYQMAALQSSAQLKAAVASGTQASGVVALGLTLATGFGSSSRGEGFRRFALLAALVEACCFGCFLRLVCSSSLSRSLLRRDTAFGPRAARAPRATAEIAEAQGESTAPPPRYSALCRSGWPCCAALLVTVSSSMLVGAWFARVRSRCGNEALPQILFYARLLSDLCGRPFTLAAPLRSVAALAVLTVLRLALVPLFFALTSTPDSETQLLEGCARDVLVVAVAALIAFGSGFVVTSCYQLAERLLPRDSESCRAKQTKLLNVVCAAAVLLGLGASVADARYADGDVPRRGPFKFSI